jgi:5-methylcytosine-specific restriction endonuclease McrA
MSNHGMKSKEKYRLKILLAERDGFICKICFKQGHRVKLTIHHKIKVSDGGSNKLENLELICEDCHRELEG